MHFLHDYRHSVDKPRPFVTAQPITLWYLFNHNKALCQVAAALGLGTIKNKSLFTQEFIISSGSQITQSTLENIKGKVIVSGDTMSSNLSGYQSRKKTANQTHTGRENNIHKLRNTVIGRAPKVRTSWQMRQKNTIIEGIFKGFSVSRTK